MNQFKIPFVLLCALFVCSLAWGGGGQGGQGSPDQDFGSRGLARGHQGGQGGQGNGRARGYQGGFDEGFGGPKGRNGKQSNGRQDDKKYRSNLYSDDDVYGYDATYPNGEASYINYKSKDARARRGPEFARTSRAYSRQGAGGSSFGQVNEYKGGRGGGGGIW